MAVFAGAHLLGRDLHRDGADDRDLGHRFAMVLNQNLAHSLTDWSGNHL